MKELDKFDLLFKLRWLGRSGNLYSVESRLRDKCEPLELYLVIYLKKSDYSMNAGVTERRRVAK